MIGELGNKKQMGRFKSARYTHAKHGWLTRGNSYFNCVCKIPVDIQLGAIDTKPLRGPITEGDAEIQSDVTRKRASFFSPWLYLKLPKSKRLSPPDSHGTK